MSKVGRNELCPCGSGKKYKRCCESKALEASAERARAVAETARARLAEERLPPARTVEWVPVVDDELDVLSNSAVDLIKEKRFDEALAICERLRVEYPEVHDWLERAAMVHEARGDAAQAIDFYRRTLAFTELPEQRDGYDEQVRDYFRATISRLERVLAGTTPT
jgi:tetratricopeptide (TPR) repeat protein